MSKKPLDAGLASILDSIRATVGGEVPASPLVAADAEPAPPEGEAPAARAAAPARRGPPPPQRTVEEFLAELIQPQVDAWLTAHLPEIVQKLTAEQVEKLLGKN